MVESETVNSPTKLSRLLPALQDTQIVVGTSLLIQPPQGVTYDLIVVVHADSWLNIPDYQSSWQTFTFLYELLSKHQQAVVLVQTYNPHHRAISYALNRNLSQMSREELAYREQHRYPPFVPMCVLMYKHEIEERLYTSVNKLYQELLYLKETYQMNDLEITTTPPLIYKMFGKYRYHILLKGEHVREFMDIVYSKLSLPTR